MMISDDDDDGTNDKKRTRRRHGVPCWLSFKNDKGSFVPFVSEEGVTVDIVIYVFNDFRLYLYVNPG